MAKENNEINDIVKECKILLLDIEGTTTSISFVKEKLFPYVEENMKSFLGSLWENDDIKEVAGALRKQAAEDQEKSVEGLVIIPGEDASKDEQIEGLVKNVKWQMSIDRKVGPLKQLQGLIWKLGYDNGDIKGHVYDDVYPALKLWNSYEGRQIYIYSSGSVQAQKLLFNKSTAGDMLPLIEGHFDTAVGTKQEAASYAAIVEKIGCKAEEVLFLTDIVKEAEAARASGLKAALVSREGNAPLPTEAALFPVLHSFEQLTFTNKRKPDPQAEEVPAKVPKTDTQDDVKTTSETEPEAAKANGVTETAISMETVTDVEKTEEPETMEVEEASIVAVEADATETNKVVEETATTVVSLIALKDVPMDDSVADVPSVTDMNVPIETPVVKADSTDNAEVKVATDNAPDLVTDKEASATDVIDVKASSVEEMNSAVKAKLETTQESKGIDVMVKTSDKVQKTKVKMVDATTITADKVSVGTQADARVLSKADAATETVTVNVHTMKANAEDAAIEQPKVIDSPVAEATAEEPPVAESITAETSVKDAEPVLATDSKDAKETVEMEATSSADDVESNKKEATNTAAPKTEETITTDLKTVEAVESKSVESIVVESTIGTGAKLTETSDSADAGNPSIDEFQAVVEAESVQNETKAAAKQEEMNIEAVVEEGTDQKDADAPACEIKPVVEEIEEKTEPNETENMETEATVSVDKVETVTEPKEASEKTQEDAIKEANLSTVEVKDITDDKENLCEVTDIIDDVVPIIEEPSELEETSQLEEMEELQNAGDVLEKECDEILLKVQDVTSMDYIPTKSLHTIDEEMETENMDTNDIVERILDSEMELSMKPEDIDLNTVQEITEPKTGTDERTGNVEPDTEKPNETPEVQDITHEKMDETCDVEMMGKKPNENNVELEIDNGNAKEILLEPAAEEMETEEVTEPVTKIESEKNIETEESSKLQESKTEVPMVDELPAETDKIEAKLENKDSSSASLAVEQETTENNGSQDAKIDDATETKVNGKTNGNAILKLNGDTTDGDNLESRLTAETVKEKVNGSNGDSPDAENGQGDNKIEAETPDIKVKMAATDEAHTPKEQPVEA